MRKDALATLKPSWVDRLERWLEISPLPWWAMLLLVAAAFMALEFGVLLVVHGFTLAEIPLWPQVIFYSLIGPYAFGLLFMLDRRAARAVERMRPLMASDRECRELAVNISTMPFVPVLIATGGGVVLFLFLRMVSHNSSELIMAGTTWITRWIRLLEGLILWVLITVSIYHTIRQLRIMDRIFTHHVKVDMFNQEPLYQLAGVAFYTAIGLNVPVSTIFVLFPPLTGDRVSLFLALTFFALSAITLFAPLYQVHQLLEEQKSAQMSENARLLAASIAKLRQQIESQSLEGLEKTHQAISALQQDREITSNVPTWPWPPGSLKTTVATLLLPTVIWLIQQTLQSMFR